MDVERDPIQHMRESQKLSIEMLSLNFKDELFISLYNQAYASMVFGFNMQRTSPLAPS